MAQYFEVRPNIHAADTTIAADIMRHFHARQYIGQAVIVCADPAAMLPAASRQWHKITRTLQRRRLATSDANEILKYTAEITHMQHLQIMAEAPHNDTHTGIYIIRPEQLQTLPTDCLTAYLAMELASITLPRLLKLLPASSLIVDYHDQIQRSDFGLLARTELERQVMASWRANEQFLNDRGITIEQLRAGSHQAADFSDILDNLLEVNIEFLHRARAFRYRLDTAQPLRTITKAERKDYELFAMLAHHVQLLTPGLAPTQFLRNYSEDFFFLRDHRHPHETWREQVSRHKQAGRWRLANALAGLARQWHYQ